MITLPRGNSREISVELTADEQPYILADGETLLFTVKKSTSKSALPIIQKKLVAEDYDEGLLIIKLRPEDTVGMDAGSYYYDLAVNIDGGEFYTVVLADEFRITATLGDKGDVYGGY